MGIGPKIKEYRTKQGLTQKDLADKLHVTYQAVSRWENDDVEPSYDTLKEMTKLFNCSADDLFGLAKNEEQKEKEHLEEEPKIIEKVIVKETQPVVLGVCHNCNKAITDPEEINRVTLTNKVRVGHRHQIVTESVILCNDCNKKRLEQIKKEEQLKEKERKNNIKKKRVRSFVWSSIVSLICIIVAIVNFSSGNTKVGIECLISAILWFTFLGTMILNNTYLPLFWLRVASWGFIRMPGVIMHFSLEGIIGGICLKVILWIIGICIALAAIAFSTLLSIILSVFTYPFAIKKNFEYVE